MSALMPWQLQEAKQRFSELVQRVLDEGPQVVTRRGEEVVVVVSTAEFQRLTKRIPDFKEFLLSAPDLDELEIDRPRDGPRQIAL
jgi:prevent-host-death family protein